MGLDLNFSTSFHPKTNGQTKRVNTLLRYYMSTNQYDWAKLLDLAQFLMSYPPATMKRVWQPVRPLRHGMNRLTWHKHTWIRHTRR